MAAKSAVPALNALKPSFIPSSDVESRDRAKLAEMDKGWNQLVSELTAPLPEAKPTANIKQDIAPEIPPASDEPDLSAMFENMRKNDPEFGSGYSYDPAQAKMAEEERQRKLQQLIGMRDIAEGLGSFKPISAAHIATGRPAPKPMVAEDIRWDIAELRDTVPEEVRNAINATYKKELIPRGMTWTNLGKFFPTSLLDPYRRMYYDIQGKFADAAQRRAKVSEETFKRPDVGTLRNIADYDKILMQAQRVKENLSELRSEGGEPVGPIIGRWNVLKGRLGIEDPKLGNLLSNVTNLVAYNLYTLSGKQINEREREELRRTVVTMYKTGATFDALIDNYIQRIRDNRDTALNVQEAVGKDVGKLRDIVPGGSSGMIEVEVNGKSGEIPAENWQAFKEKYPGAIRK